MTWDSHLSGAASKSAAPLSVVVPQVVQVRALPVIIDDLVRAVHDERVAVDREPAPQRVGHSQQDFLDS